ncbi:hypothetical protein M409DRAFT_27613 [Zasmidium cellare ATCC 36951]|uniref:Uncharacterized protein n=1 Tax=Zasmidium cellare ATCC 36951 TaxID=1080233 RepID=A0A6A6C4D6_ZASCE|nr:uncharacterized protein M409DRAFT_27613 [Zasmidium cellare ATCC 36951]KAF2161885.1 hypothetical protein M409DRAFT_27613 [Zasmidium cellare ATCC 36951]
MASSEEEGMASSKLRTSKKGAAATNKTDAFSLVPSADTMSSAATDTVGSVMDPNSQVASANMTTATTSPTAADSATSADTKSMSSTNATTSTNPPTPVVHPHSTYTDTIRGVVKPNSSTTSPTSANASNFPQDDSKRHIFPFFDLPRELRDMAYDKMLISSVSKKLPCQLQITVVNMAEVKLMTINRQFAHEYKERAEKEQATTLTDGPDVDLDDLSTDVMPLPTLLRATKILKIDIAGGSWSLSRHKSRISTIAAANSHLTSLSVKIVLTYRGFMGNVRELLRDLATVQKLVSLEVFAEDMRYEVFDFEYQNLLVLRWSAESGLWETFEPAGVQHALARLVEKF